MGRRVNHLFLIVCFLLALVAPVLNDSFQFVQFERHDENRRFHDSLAIKMAKLDAFPKECEAYINDNFAFRTPFIEWNNYLKLYAFHVSPDPERLIIGRNNRYFIAGDEKAIYEGYRDFTKAELTAFEAEWWWRKKYFDSLNIPVYLIAAPTGLEIYPEDLPFYIKKRNPRTRIDGLKATFQKRMPGVILDMKDVLLAAKKEGNLFFRYDNHWTQKAGFIVTRYVLKQLKRRHFPELSTDFLNQYRWKKEYRDQGYFITILGLPGLHEYVPVDYGRNEQAMTAEKFGFPVTPDFMYPSDFEMHFVNKQATNKLKVLLIRDSFGEAVYPYLKEAFAESLVIFDSWKYGRNRNIVETYKPDVVLYMSYEPHLANYLFPESHSKQK